MKLNTDERKRLKKIISRAIVILAIGILYALFVKLTGVSIPCIFHKVTGLHCPGCGISRMFLALLELNIVKAARYNLFVLCMLPFFLAVSLYKAALYVRSGNSETGKAEKAFYIVALILCAVFFVLRNTNAIPFLSIP